MTITGSGFTGATSVKFGATAATAMTVGSDAQITATSPAGSDTVDVTVTTPAGTSATSAADSFTYTAIPAVVTGISPRRGDRRRREQRDDHRQRFPRGSKRPVRHSQRPGHDGRLRYPDHRHQPGRRPRHRRRHRDQPRRPLGDAAPRTSSPTSPRRPSPGFPPPAEPQSAATIVTITGTGFSPGNVSVQFGTLDAPAMTVVSGTQITATSPAGTGTVDVTMSNTSGTSATSAAGRFGYIPAVTGISPASGPVSGGTP